MMNLVRATTHTFVDTRLWFWMVYAIYQRQYLFAVFFEKKTRLNRDHINRAVVYLNIFLPPAPSSAHAKHVAAWPYITYTT